MLNFCTEFGSNTYKHLKYTLQIQGFSTPNAANNGRLVVVIFVQQWRSHAQKARLQGCPSHEMADVAWPCYISVEQPFTFFNVYFSK
ncbi:hypothetical protein [Alkalimarinus alittae]|uniref:Uncharacterized protein n=1 Tax=Alkalimarinus alittae TaxID=2961619 RepID=A0ABY6N4Y2_9ALTE|nr:hypothetical protein [Alkalimarinus alittae]UZE97178.1 hypothetical protein NKI27_05365 [Alkalimarinus alittae]